MGKVLLWAASPLNNLGAELGASKNGDTYKYNVELAAQAADALGEALSEVNSGKTPYALAEYKYSNIYDHEAADGSSSNFSDIFRTTGQGWKQPGSTEAILRAPYIGANGSNWNFTKLWGIKMNGNHDYTIGSTAAIKHRSLCTLEERDALYLGRGYVACLTWHTINEDKCVRISPHAVAIVT